MFYVPSVSLADSIYIRSFTALMWYGDLQLWSSNLEQNKAKYRIAMDQAW